METLGEKSSFSQPCAQSSSRVSGDSKAQPLITRESAQTAQTAQTEQLRHITTKTGQTALSQVQNPESVPKNDHKIKDELGQKLRGDEPRVSNIFKKELQGAYELHQLTRIDQHYAGISSIAQLETIRMSQNPVTRLESPTFISHSALKAANKRSQGAPPVDTIILRGKFKDVFEGKDNKGKELNTEQKTQIGQLVKPVCNAFSKTPGDSNAKLAAAITILNREIALQGEYGKDVSHLNCLLKELEGLREGIRVEGLEGLPVYYRKSDVLNSLHIEHLSTHGDTACLKAMKEIEKLPQEYINEETFNRLEAAGIDKKILERIKKNQPSYVSSQEVISANNNEPRVKELLNKLGETKYQERPNFAFKTGLENEREKLFGDVFKTLGTENYVLKKTDVKLARAELMPNPELKSRLIRSPAQMEALKSPEGIAGRWLEGTNVPEGTWNSYQAAKMELARAQFLKEPDAKIEELKQKVNKLAEEVASYGGKNSVAEHCINDLLICQSDGHWGQYLSDNQEFMTYDVARALPPSYGINVGKETFAMMKSEMLGHPFADNPMSQNLIKTILSWNPLEIEKDLKSKGRIGGSQEFEAIGVKLEEIKADIAKIQYEEDNPKIIEELCKKYQVPFDSGKLSETVSKLHLQLDRAGNETSKQCFGKIHPQALAEFQERMHLLQEYVKTAQSPTPKGAFEAMYPDLAPFIKVLERTEGNPFVAISESNHASRSLQEIIKKAEFSGIATADELQAMKTALSHLSAKASNGRELATTTMGMLFAHV